MKNINLKLNGPFKLTEFIEIPESLNSGIYIFTIKIDKKYVIEYVGITARKFQQRFLEHIKEILSGGYVLYDLEKMKSVGDDFFVWNGRFGKNREKMSDFFKNYNNLSKVIKKQIEAFEIFTIPLKADKRILEIIEGEFYKVLRKDSNKITKKCLDGVNSSPIREGEKELFVKIENNMFFPEIPDNFTIKR